MSIRPPPLPKNEEKYREEILDRIEEGWQGEEWAINVPKIANEILHQNLLTRTPPATRTEEEEEEEEMLFIGIQMEDHDV